MSPKVLVVGYGSIGKRHARIISELKEVKDLRVVTSQKDIPFNSFASLEEAIKYNPDYIIISSETSSHLNNLTYVVNNYPCNKILVEKPLFSEYANLDTGSKSIFVGYNLRFHPLIKALKDLIINQEIKAVYCHCHTYLPDWREKDSYQESYSSSSERGGGVILDLSHEIDLLMWLFGSVGIDYIKYGKFSNLSIQSEDYLLLSGNLFNQAPIELSLSYFSMVPKRQIHVVTNEQSVLVDLISNSITIKKNSSEILKDSLNSFQRDTTYIDQHKAILAGESGIACKYSEGLEVNKFIDEIKSWRRK